MDSTMFMVSANVQLDAYRWGEGLATVVVASKKYTVEQSAWITVMLGQ